MNGVWRDREREGREPGVARIVYLDADDEGMYGVEIPVPEPPNDINYRATRKAIYEVARIIGVNFRKSQVRITTEAGEECVAWTTPSSSVEYAMLPGLYRIEFA